MGSDTAAGERPTIKRELDAAGVLYAPGAWDGVSARLAEQAGCRAVLTPGFAISAALGLPDADLYTKTDNLSAVRTVTASCSLAVVADIDGGYGNAVNVFHTVRDFEAVGVSAVMLEDQVLPKRCNFSVRGQVELTELGTACRKIQAATDARRSADTLIIARTDAEGDEIYRRGAAYAEAGADMVLPISVSSEFGPESWQRLHEKAGVPLATAFVPGFWHEERLTPAVLREIGVRLVMCGLHPLYAGAAAMKRAYELLAGGAPPADVSREGMSHHDFSALMGFPEVNEMQARYLPAREPGA
jgi:methylisocitrate lyase